MTYVWIFAAESALALVVYVMWLFDRLVRWEYEHCPDQWERDGSPNGYFWRARECRFWSSDIAKHRLGLAWQFHTPPWAADSRECRRWLLRMRIVAVIWYASILAVVVRFWLIR